MATYRIIVESTSRRWWAWFQDAPETKASGRLPTLAVQRLIEVISHRFINSSSMHADEEAGVSGHLEFVVKGFARDACMSPESPRGTAHELDADLATSGVM